MTRLGLRYLLLNSPLTGVLTVVEVVVLPLSLYLGAGTKFAEDASSVLDLDVGEVYLLSPLLRDLLSSLFFDVVVSVRGAFTGSFSATRLIGLLNRPRPEDELGWRVGFRDFILTLDLLDGGIVVVVSELPDLLRVKPKGRGCDTTAIVDLLPRVDAVVVVVVVVIVVVVVDGLELVTVAGTVVNSISVAESSTSFTESVVEPMVVLGLTLDGFCDGSTLITVITSVEVEVVVAGVADDEVAVPAVVLDISEYSSSLVGKVVSLIASVRGPTLDDSSEVFEVVLLNLCILVYL